MAIYKNKKTNTWYYRIYVTDAKGIRKQKYKSGFNTKTEAINAERELILNYKDISNYNITFQELYDIYMVHEKQQLKPNSYSTIKNIYETHILPYFKDYKLDKIDGRCYIEFKSKILEKNYSHKYNCDIHKRMVAILNFGVKFYNLKENVASKVGNFSKKNEITNVDFWEYEEFTKFIKLIQKIEYKALFTTLYFTGARLGELLALTWEDITDNYININKNAVKGQNGKRYIIQSPKTKESYRKIKIDAYTSNILIELKKYYAKMVGFNDKFFIFGGLLPLSRTNITREKNYYCKIANVKQIRLHDFRHSCASLFISMGAPLTVVQKRLGHKNLSTTLNIYSHLVTTDEDKAINMIETLNKNLL